MSDLMRISNIKNDKLFKVVDIKPYNSIQWEKFKNAYLKNKYYKITIEKEITK